MSVLACYGGQRCWLMNQTELNSDSSCVSLGSLIGAPKSQFLHLKISASLSISTLQGGFKD